MSPIGRRVTRTAVALVFAAAACVSCPGQVGLVSPRRAEAAAAPIRVLYAGSLVSLFEHGLAPAFTKDTGVPVLGRAGGSTALAHMIRDGLERADVFISADPAVNATLGAGAASWFLTLGSTTMVVAYTPAGRFAPLLRRAVDPGPAAGDAAAPVRAWYRVLETPGLRIGRTDPVLDPKGYRTILALRLAERYYRAPGLAARILGADENAAQIFPEEALVGRLTSGQLDAGFFYLLEARAQRLPYIALPPAINLGDPAQTAAYAKAVYRDAAGRIHRGAPILFTITIPPAAHNVQGAVRFAAFLLGGRGRGLLAGGGLVAVPVLAGGNAGAVPASLRPLIAGPYYK